jgi:hypothetical protein
MSVPDHMAQVRALRNLAGDTRPTDTLLADMLVAARRLEGIVSQWATFAPRPRTIIDAEHMIEGLRRSLADLQTRIGADREVAQ